MIENRDSNDIYNDSEFPACMNINYDYIDVVHFNDNTE